MAYLGEIRMFAGNYAPSGWAECDGSTLTITDYSELWSYIGKTYGGDGLTTFALPNLGSNAPLHRTNVNAMGQTSSGPLGVALPTAPIKYLIALSTPASTGPVPFVGEIRTFSFGAVPKGWVLCDGTMLNAASSGENEVLYSILGTLYGGDSEQGTFALPDLRANTVKPVAGNDPLGCIVMSYCIATTGTYPAKN
jgi:microcystin-dependent protein